MLDETSLSTKLLELARAAAPALAQAQGDPRCADLRESGLTSIAAVRLMLEIEAAFDLAIPDGELTPENFATIVSIEKLIRRLEPAAA